MFKALLREYDFKEAGIFHQRIKKKINIIVFLIIKSLYTYMAIITVLKDDWEWPFPWKHDALRPQVIEAKVHLNDTVIEGSGGRFSSLSQCILSQCLQPLFHKLQHNTRNQ